MRHTINKDLQKYIEEHILTQYDKNNVGGHGKAHIETVIKRCFEIIEEYDLDVDPDMIYTIASFHDIGYRVDPDRHEEVSSEMFMQDKTIKNYFNATQLTIMADAIVDHRASLEYDARNIYGKIVSSADREIDVENMLRRSILYQADKHSAENPTEEQVIEYSFKKLSSKYGKGGYAKMYYPDKKYTEYLDKMQRLFEDKNHFIEAEKALIAKEGLLSHTPTK